jgi:uncharacterized membrane protein YdfJ with MMPL/SSD domain
LLPVALIPVLSAIDLKHLGDEAMTISKLLFVPILAILLVSFHAAPLQAQNAMPSSGTDTKSMKSQMEQMRAQMEQMQALMKDNMAKMAAADAAMKSHMETEQASMKGQMELQQAMLNQLQTMTDQMQTMTDRMAMMPDPMDMHKKTGATTKKDKGMADDQKK